MAISRFKKSRSPDFFLQRRALTINSDKHPRRRVTVNTSSGARFEFQAAMARAHRVALYSSAFILIYFLVFFAVLPVPLLEPDIVAQLLPVVRASGRSTKRD